MHIDNVIFLILSKIAYTKFSEGPFEDRHSEANDAYDDSGLFSRASYNFSLAVYDRDTNRLYYFEFDT